MAWGLNPGWTQASQGHVAGHAGPSAGWPETCPLAPSWCIKDFGTFHPRIRHSLSQTERVFYNDLFLTLFCVFSLRTLEDDSDAPGPAPGPAGCRGRLLPLCPVPLRPQPSSWALGGPQGSLSSLPRAHQLVHSAVPFLEPWGCGWASPQLAALVWPRPVVWSLCKSCPGRLHGRQGGC